MIPRPNSYATGGIFAAPNRKNRKQKSTVGDNHTSTRAGDEDSSWLLSSESVSNSTGDQGAPGYFRSKQEPEVLGDPRTGPRERIRPLVVQIQCLASRGSTNTILGRRATQMWLLDLSRHRYAPSSVALSSHNRCGVDFARAPICLVVQSV